MLGPFSHHGEGQDKERLRGLKCRLASFVLNLTRGHRESNILAWTFCQNDQRRMVTVNPNYNYPFTFSEETRGRKPMVWRGRGKRSDDSPLTMSPFATALLSALSS